MKFYRLRRNSSIIKKVVNNINTNYRSYNCIWNNLNLSRLQLHWSRLKRNKRGIFRIKSSRIERSRRTVTGSSLAETFGIRRRSQVQPGASKSRRTLNWNCTKYHFINLGRKSARRFRRGRMEKKTVDRWGRRRGGGRNAGSTSCWKHYFGDGVWYYKPRGG